MSDFLDLQGAKDLNTDAIHIGAVANSKDPVTGAEIDTHVNRVGGTDYTLQGFWNSIGPVVMTWTSVTGGTLTQPNQAFLHPTNGNYYSWAGEFPKVVAPGTDPTLSGSGYVPRADVVLRSQLADVNGASLSLSQIATNYSLPFSLGGKWEEGESLSVGDWRYFDNKVWVPNANNSICGASPDYSSFHIVYPWQSPDECYLSGFGTLSDGQDGTAALTRAINYAKNNWITVVNDVRGTLYISAALPVMNSPHVFRSVRYRTVNRQECILKFDGNGSTIQAAPYGFNYYAGSGGIFGVGISDATLIGGATVSPIKVQGFGGLIVHNCTIIGSVAATLSNDISTGTFTEFFKFTSCDIHCGSVFTMYRGAGDRSFHGCGWDDNCVINVSSDKIIQLGILGESTSAQQVVWYNGSVGGSVFTTVAGTTFIYSPNSYNIASFSGNLKFESSTTVQIEDGVYGAKVYFTGGIQGIGDKVSYGAAIPCSKFDLDSTGTPKYIEQPSVGTVVKPATGADAVTIGGIGAGSDAGMGTLYMVTCAAPSYEYQQLWLVVGQISPAIAPTVTKLGEGRAFNQAGFGAPTLRWLNNDTLQVQNSSWTAAQVTVSWVRLGTARL